MAQSTQTYKNHVRLLPPFHFFVIPVLALNFVNTLRHVWLTPNRSSAWAAVVAAALLTLGFLARIMALSVQDRVIRLEMRQRLNQALPAHQSSLIIIGADEKQAPARGCVRVDRDDRNASVNRTVNPVFHCIRIGNRDKNACGPLLDGPEQFFTFGGGIISIRSGEGVANTQLLGRLRESSSGTLPVRDLDVDGNQHIALAAMTAPAICYGKN